MKKQHIQQGLQQIGSQLYATATFASSIRALHLDASIPAEESKVGIADLKTGSANPFSDIKASMTISSLEDISIYIYIIFLMYM